MSSGHCGGAAAVKSLGKMSKKSIDWNVWCLPRYTCCHNIGGTDHDDHDYYDSDHDHHLTQFAHHV